MAVAIKEMGFTNIKIYNGGLKDWERYGYEIERLNPLNDPPDRYISSEELWERMNEIKEQGCVDENNDPLITLVDYRTEIFFEKKRPLVAVKHPCNTIRIRLDDLLDESARNTIPQKGIVVFLSETGNRDWAALSFLSTRGWNNCYGLRFGMRGWIKADLPVETLK